MIGRPNRTLLRTHDVFKSSQLVIEDRSALVEVIHMTMHSTMMVVQEERSIAPIAPIELEL